MECKTDFGRNKTTIEQRVTNSTIIITIYENLFFAEVHTILKKLYLVSCSVITENSKEHSEVFVE